MAVQSPQSTYCPEWRFDRTDQDNPQCHARQAKQYFPGLQRVLASSAELVCVTAGPIETKVRPAAADAVKARGIERGQLVVSFLHSVVWDRVILCPRVVRLQLIVECDRQKLVPFCRILDQKKCFLRRYNHRTAQNPDV